MNLGKKTKIVCTLGPVSGTEDVINDFIKSGMNVARLNFSHGSLEDHQIRLDLVRRVSEKLEKPIAILQDLCGPKIRIGSFKDNSTNIEAGQKFILTTENIEGDSNKVSINFPVLTKEVKPGTIILLQDGTKKLEVTEVNDKEITTKVIVGGKILSHQGVNIPGADLSFSALTEKDKSDLDFAIKNKIDFVALSFVRREDDIKELRSILESKGSNAQIIAKIETPEAVKNIDSIIQASDGIMIARGDLAIEIPAEEVPIVQKIMIHKCNNAGKPVITATQMLESMVKSSVPTRAEVSDIANAIIDGTDAIMLSEETAVGDNPIEAIKIMTKVALRIEEEVYTRDTIAEYDQSHGTTDVISQSAVRAAHAVNAKLIVALTRSGRTARMVARYRPTEHILALTDSRENVNRLTLTFGCHPMISPTFNTVPEIMSVVKSATLENKLAKEGDRIVIAAGMPFGVSNETNFILIETL